MAKWMDKVEKRNEQRMKNYDKGVKLLKPLFEKYNFDLATEDISGKEWTKTEKRNFLKGIVYIGYSEDIVKLYGFYPFEAK